MAEAQRIGIYDTLLERCAHELPIFDTVGMGPPRDLRATSLPRQPALALYHPAMQEALLDAARAAGAEVWRGATVREVRPGEPPAAILERDGQLQELNARLVVCADGRSSAARQWGGFAVRREKQKKLGAGVLLEDVATAQDTGIRLPNLQMRRIAYLFPQGNGRVRAYLVYDPTTLDRLQGSDEVARFIDECVKTGLSRKHFVHAQAAGPLASFDMTETWLQHPYKDGIALIGDAAGSSDPNLGQGLSITMRDVRELSESLLAIDDWDAAGHRYAQARDVYFQTALRVEGWVFDLFFGEGSEADKLRARALPLLAVEPDRMPDHGMSGLDLPSDDDVRRRFFGEI